jgi:hypothetical protein
LERVLTLVVGTLLLVGGLAIGWLPGPGGFLAVFGAALLGVEWLRVARILDRCETYLRGFVRFVRRRVLGRARAAD